MSETPTHDCPYRQAWLARMAHRSHVQSCDQCEPGIAMHKAGYESLIAEIYRQAIRDLRKSCIAIREIDLPIRATDEGERSSEIAKRVRRAESVAHATEARIAADLLRNGGDVLRAHCSADLETWDTWCAERGHGSVR